ncbi:short-chain dehydrogenase reductase family [Colletotrichum plurivorum]|uniref:Short-chain dehydrogenase reductase family n=1 Tax=Colletotrichum plurivorum TaxID=2175906 RepID=A0A8H6NCC3_9PEZI|nr:short-chain dehydrogenase reductase family [Colletotrichum plurivorum]
MAETVLIFGASGNIGISAVIGALRAKRNVIAVVRSKASGQKILDYVGPSEGITIVEADMTSMESLRGVVNRIREGKLPSFQHVFASRESLLPT